MAGCNYWRQQSFSWLAANFQLLWLTLTSSASAWIHLVTSISLGDRRRAVRAICSLTSASCGCCWNVSWNLAIWGAHSHYCIQWSNPACYSQFAYGRLLLFCIICGGWTVLCSCWCLQIHLHHGWFTLWQNPAAEESTDFSSSLRIFI